MQPLWGHSYKERTDDIDVVVRPFYIEEKSDEENGLYFYVYRVTIINNSKEPIQVLKRKWFIRDGNGEEQHLSGDGVVGELPIIDPGRSYHYTSFCPLGTPTGNMRGQYLVKDHSGDTSWIDVPLFFLRKPETFH